MIGEVMLIAIDALDKLSRLRALDDVESHTLERLIRTQESSVSGRARVAEWQKNGLITAMHIPDDLPISWERDRELARAQAYQEAAE